MARQTGRAAGAPLKRLTLELGRSRNQLAAETARAFALVNPALKIRNGIWDCPPTNARPHQNIHYSALS